MKVAFLTLGCKVNQVETENMIAEEIRNGNEIVDFDSPADVYVINTCTVTSVADQKSRQMIRRALKNPTARVIVTGCYSNVAFDEISAIDPRIEIRAKTIDFPMNSTSYHTRAYLKIEDGCENFCSYCIIPLARGKIRSKKLSEIRNDVENLVSNGTQEIVLTGIHLGAYGRDLGKNLADAVRACLEVQDLKRLRLSSLESIEFSSELLDLFSDPRLCQHLHLPLQSGSDRILKLMRRPYDRKKFSYITNSVREKVPRITLTTDVIVGFPSESDSDFSDTLNFCRDIGFAKIHVFPFSPRRGTPAFKFDNQIPSEIKKARVDQLLKLSSELEKNFHESQIGRELEVLFEQRIDEFSTGHDKFYSKVFTKNPVKLGKILKIKVESIFRDGVIGRLIE
ncbi:MAG: MiaB/RimO family radical SAM methylthiotransferase [Selenomonadaceae bacterium]|nr:MiaB/RimO family radical SAM methylthiotransferase [Selenomonadaceae bacterium]